MVKTVMKVTIIISEENDVFLWMVMVLFISILNNDFDLIIMTSDGVNNDD